MQRFLLCARDSWDGTLLYAAKPGPLWIPSECWTEYRSDAHRYDRPDAIARLRYYFCSKGKPLTTEPIWIEPAD